MSMSALNIPVGCNISLIAARSENNVIGKNGALPWYLPQDFKWFKEKTKNRVIIMGRRTWESLPAKPLPGRRNIVITTNAGFEAGGAKVCTSLDEAIANALRDSSQYDLSEIMIIGGEMLFRATLDHAKKMYMTEVLTSISGGDSYFPDFNAEHWSVKFETDYKADHKNKFDMRFVELERR